MHPIELIIKAKEWIGTPYHDQARVQQLGADCVGFPAGVIHELGFNTDDIPNDYPRYSIPEVLFDYLDTSELVTRDEYIEIKPARLVVFNILGEPRHFGIISSYTHFLHAHEQYGVIEDNLTGRWNSRIHSTWKFNFVTDDE